MSDIESVILDTYHHYLLHLADGGQPTKVPRLKQGEESGRWVHPSDLMSCPLKATLRRRNVPPTIPEMDFRNRPWLAHIFEYGRRTAEVVQESLLWSDVFEDVRVELPLESESDSLRGTCDALFRHEGVLWVLELKHRGARWIAGKRREQAEPMLGDVYQLLAYALMVRQTFGELPKLALGLIDKEPARPKTWDGNPGIHIWTLESVDGGYVLIDSEGNPYDAIWNQAEVLNFSGIREEIGRQLRYIDGERQTPIIDPINDPDGWQCIQKVVYPSGRKPGLIAPACEFSCHFSSIHSRAEYVKHANGTYAAVYETAPLLY